MSDMERLWGAWAKAPKCQGIRRDGAPCQNPARRGGFRCARHGGGWKNSKATKEQAALNKEMARKALNAPSELKALPEWREIEPWRAVKRLAALVDAFEAFQQSGDVEAFQTAKRGIIEGFRANQARQAKALERRRLERQALGIPDPADPRKW